MKPIHGHTWNLKLNLWSKYPQKSTTHSGSRPMMAVTVASTACHVVYVPFDTQTLLQCSPWNDGRRNSRTSADRVENDSMASRMGALEDVHKLSKKARTIGPTMYMYRRSWQETVSIGRWTLTAPRANEEINWTGSASGPIFYCQGSFIFRDNFRTVGR